MKVQGRRKRGRPRRRWLERVRDDIKENGLSADDMYDRATWRRMSTPHKCGNKRRKKKYNKCYVPQCIACFKVCVTPLM